MSNILLGVSAGIAAYKSADLASKLTQRGDSVRTILTPGAQKFITPLTFGAVTRQEVFTDLYEDDPSYKGGHISLSEWADLLLVAPATADLIGKLAAGLGGDLLTVTALAFDKPVLFAPAMNDRMWKNPVVQENITRLQEVLGYKLINPGEGHLACGSIGPGRLAEVPELIEALDQVLQPETEQG